MSPHEGVRLSAKQPTLCAGSPCPSWWTFLLTAPEGIFLSRYFFWDLPVSECREISLALSALTLVCPKANFSAEWLPLKPVLTITANNPITTPKVPRK